MAPSSKEANYGLCIYKKGTDVPHNSIITGLHRIALLKLSPIHENDLLNGKRVRGNEVFVFYIPLSELGLCPLFFEATPPREKWILVTRVSGIVIYGRMDKRKELSRILAEEATTLMEQRERGEIFS